MLIQHLGFHLSPSAGNEDIGALWGIFVFSARTTLLLKLELYERIEMKRTSVFLAVTLLALSLLSAPRLSAQVSTPNNICGETIFALTLNQRIISFNSETPGTLASSVAVTGLQQGETLLGIDIRPRDRQLYGATSQNRIVTINPVTGATTPVITLSTPLNGAAFGFDFNPRADRLRITSDQRQNLRIDVTAAAGNTTSDGQLTYAPLDPNNAATPRITGSAYTNNFDLSPATALYGIDSNLDILVLQNPPNDGTLNTVGNLNFDTGDLVGFDISSTSARAFASLTSPGGAVSSLAMINLSTGASTLIGAIGGGQPITGLAVSFNRQQTVYALTQTNRLITFNSLTPGVITGIVTISGLGRGERLLGIDFRPATGALYALSNFANLYTIDERTGRATRLITSSPFGNTFAFGASFGFDFNPVVDRLRIVNDSDQNFRIVPNDGSLAGTDGTLAFNTSPADRNAGINPNVVGAAYSNNIAGAASTILYDIDHALNILAIQNPPNNGTLNTLGTLTDEATATTLDVTSKLGFDIYRCDPVGLISVTLAGDTVSRLYRVNLATASVVQVGAIGGGEFIIGIAVK